MTTNSVDETGLRERLISAAATLVAERGPHGFSLREVARRAGVSHAAPGHHFGSSQGLMTAVALAGFERLAAALDATDTDDVDALERFRTRGATYLEMARRYPGYYAVMFTPGLAETGNPELEAAGAAAYDSLIETVTRLRDEINAELDVEIAAAMAWSTMAGLVVLAPILDQKLPDADEPLPAFPNLLDRFVDLMVSGFRRA